MALVVSARPKVRLLVQEALPRHAVLRQQVVTNAFEKRLRRRRRGRRVAEKLSEVAREQPKLRMVGARAPVQADKPPGALAESRAQMRDSSCATASSTVACARCREGTGQARPTRPGAGRSSRASPSRSRNSPSSAKSSAISVWLDGQTAADSQRAFERFADQTRRFGFVGEVEPGSTSASSGNSRSRARQNASMVEIEMSVSALANLAPRARARSVSSARCCASSWRMRCRISAAALRVNVIARMFRGLTPADQQPDVAIDEHPRLACAGRRFERDVAGRDRWRARAPRHRAPRADRAPLSKSSRGCSLIEPSALGALQRYSRRHTARYGHGPQSDFFAGLRREATTRDVVERVTSRSCASSSSSSSVRPFGAAAARPPCRLRTTGTVLRRSSTPGRRAGPAANRARTKL